MMPTETPPRLSYGVGEAAEALGVTRQFLYRLIANGQIDSFKITRRRLIRASELERIMREGVS